MKELEYPFDAEYILKRKKSIKRELLKSKEKNFLNIKIAILGGGTTSAIKDILEIFLLNYSICACFYESEYNRYYEDVMFPNLELEKFHPDIIFICTSNRNIMDYPQMSDSDEVIEDKLNSVTSKFENMWKRIKEVYHCPIIQNNFELPFYRLMGNKDSSDIHGRAHFISELNMRFYKRAAQYTGLYIHDIHYESASYGLEKWLDPFYWYMYKYALCLPAIPYYAFNVANIIKSIYGKNKKVLMLDLDNTLWGGIIGDDGVESIEIGQESSVGQAYSEFQMYVKAHKQLGVLLTINSKNDLEVALSGFRRPDSILKKDDFVVVKSNWEPKDKNLRETAEELNLLPESFVFVDDNPAERERVRTMATGVAVPEMARPEHYIQLLSQSGFFEVTDFSEDDLKRNKMYEENIRRLEVESTFQNYTDYLLELDMKGEIGEFSSIYMSRIAQLTNKSNQFNLTTRRYSLAEIEKMASDPKYVTLYGKLEDKFGDNGVVSVVIGIMHGNELYIDLWLMSCRVLKRDMELAMMDELIAVCKKKKICLLVGYFFPTAKNGMVKEFYGELGFKKVEEDEKGNSTWQFKITEDYVNKNKVIKVIKK